LRKSIIYNIFFPQEVHPIRLPAFWACDCGRPNFTTPCSCGLRKIRQAPAARLRTWGLFPVPWPTLFGPLFEVDVADALEDEARRALVKELGEAGLVVIDQGNIYLPNLQTVVEQDIFDFNRRTMLKVLKAALYTTYRYAGKFFSGVRLASRTPATTQVRTTEGVKTGLLFRRSRRLPAGGTSS